MNIMRRIFDAAALIILVAITLAVTGCSEQAKQPEAKPDASSQPASEPELVTVNDTIEYVLNEAITRLKYGDKTGLWENEFPYLREETNFDEYLKLRAIKFAEADTVRSIEVTDVKLHEHDSAEVDLIVHFEGPTGTHTEFPDWIIVYYHDGRWMKPTASSIVAQLEYEQAKGEGGSGK